DEPGAPSGRIISPFNSSNTAEESPAVTSNRSLAENRRFSPAGSSLSRSSEVSARMRTRVAAEVETVRLKAESAPLDTVVVLAGAAESETAFIAWGEFTSGA